MSQDAKPTLIIVASIRQLLGPDVRRTKQDRGEPFAGVLETKGQYGRRSRSSERARQRTNRADIQGLTEGKCAPKLVLGFVFS